MGVAARRSGLKNKADTLFEKKVKAEYDQIAAMKEQLQKNKKILAVDEANLKLVNGWRYLGETRAGSRVGLLEEALQYRGALKVCGSRYSFISLEARDTDIVLQRLSPESLVNGERLNVQRLRSDIREKERKLKREISKYHKNAGKKAKKNQRD
jgi:hypothetical protein